MKKVSCETFDHPAQRRSACRMLLDMMRCGERKWKCENIALVIFSLLGILAGPIDLTFDMEFLYPRVSSPGLEVMGIPVRELFIHGTLLTVFVSTGVIMSRIFARLRGNQQELLIYQDELRSLGSQLTLVEERERRNIATELHDHVGQALALTMMRLGILKETMEAAGSAQAVGQLDRIIPMIEDLLKHTRSLTLRLSSPVLRELGLEAAVEGLSREIPKQYGIACDFLKEDGPKPLDEDTSASLFRAVNELVVNVVKHAKADKLRLNVGSDGKSIRIAVEDNGIGFDATRIDRLKGGGGFGLFSIRERMCSIGGRLEIESECGSGTRAILTAPLRAGAGEGDDSSLEE